MYQVIAISYFSLAHFPTIGLSVAEAFKIISGCIKKLKTVKGFGNNFKADT